MIYRPPTEKWVFLDRNNFTFRRWIRLPYKVSLNWIWWQEDAHHLLREPTPIPMCLKEHLKPGYYWSELIH